MAEKRVDPVDGYAYSYAELSAHYKRQRYKQKEIDAYWEQCYPEKQSSKKKGANKKKDGGYKVADQKQDDSTVTRKPRPTVCFGHAFVKKSTRSIDECYDIEKGSIWGEGAFGQVVIGKEKDTGESRAIKCIDKSKIPDKERFKLEIDIQKKMAHINVVKLCATFEDARMHYLVLELCEGDELFKYISEYESFSEKHSSSCLGQILGAVHYIHSLDIVHRDIKPENVLLEKEWEDDEEYPKVKLIDFGAARHFEVGSGKPMKTWCGTVDYLSPQHVLGKGYNEKCDVWSCGILAYQMLSGEVPFFAETTGEIKRLIREGKLEFPDSEWEEISAEAQGIIKLMLTYNEQERPSAKTLLQDNWIKEYTTLSDKALPKNMYDRMRGFQAFSKLKRVALTVIAQQVCGGSDLEDLRCKFQELDTDRDGFITVDEMVSVFKTEKADTGEFNFPQHDKPEFEDVLRSCNTSGSQQIDITEFLAATMDRQSYNSENVLWSAFRTFDSDNDGKISKKNLAELLGERDENSPSVEAIFKEAQSDHGIDFNAFRLAVEAEASSRKFTVSSVSSTEGPGGSPRKSLVFIAKEDVFAARAPRKSLAQLKTSS